MNIPPAVKQFIRFALIGALNTAVDFLILNGLILAFGLDKNDPKYIIFKIISFTAAVTNSFLWNKWWVFRKRNADEASQKNLTVELTQFISISVVGLIIDIVIATAVYHSGHIWFPDISTTWWANIGALAGTLVVLVSNFFGYKFIVFKK